MMVALKTLLFVLLAGFCLHHVQARAAGDYDQNTQLQTLIAQLEQDKVYAPGELEELFHHVRRQDRVLAAIARPAEGKQWKDYRPLFLQNDRIQAGVEFWNRNALDLDRAYRVYGVPPEMIVAILGVETKYGRGQGRFRVLDTLSTLAFDYPPRSPFFSQQLREFLILCKEQGLDPLSTYGSYAGAMGYPQFMPSSWRSLAVDFNGDGHSNLIDNPSDAIGSIGNYFKAHGWKRGEAVTLPARIIGNDYDSAVTTDLKTSSTLKEIADKGLIPRDNGSYLASQPTSAIRLLGENGPEYWLTFDNFYVITTYNKSILYAMAAYQLSQAIKAAHDAGQAANPPAQPVSASALSQSRH